MTHSSKKTKGNLLEAGIFEKACMFIKKKKKKRERERQEQPVLFPCLLPASCVDLLTSTVTSFLQS